jgi:hypothetical protein
VPAVVDDDNDLNATLTDECRLMDISMKAFNNARERDAETWVSLFRQADSRFIFTDLVVPPESRMAIIVAEWAG